MTVERIGNIGFYGCHSQMVLPVWVWIRLTPILMSVGSLGNNRLA